MRIGTVVLFIVFFSSPAFAADQYCRVVNRDNVVVNDAQMANAMNRWLIHRKVQYKTTAKEIQKTIKSFCASNPGASSNEVTAHLENIVDALDGLTRQGKMK